MIHDHSSLDVESQPKSRTNNLFSKNFYRYKVDKFARIAFKVGP